MNKKLYIESAVFCSYGEIVRYETKEDAQKSIKKNEVEEEVND